MNNPNNNQISRNNDPEWYILAEYSLSKLMLNEDVGDELTVGLLSHATQDLDIPLKFLQNIERALIEFAREAMVHFNKERLDSPLYIRVFCQKKAIKGVNSSKTSSHFIAESATEPTQIYLHSDTKINGGWGYFLIDRGGGFVPGSSVSTYYPIDLYLYKEGE